MGDLERAEESVAKESAGVREAEGELVVRNLLDHEAGLDHRTQHIADRRTTARDEVAERGQGGAQALVLERGR